MMQVPGSFVVIIFLAPIALTVVIMSQSPRYYGNSHIQLLLIALYILLTILAPILIGIHYYNIDVNSPDFVSLLQLILIGRVLDTVGTSWPLVIKRNWKSD